MGLKLRTLFKTGTLSSLALAGVLAASVLPANAQPVPPAGGQGGGGTGTGYVYNTISNTYLTMYVGFGANVAGSLGLWTNLSNSTDPFNAIMYGGPIQPSDSPVPVPYFGGWLYLRIDDGATGSLHGNDYLFGDPANGGWLVPPTIVGNQIQARWATKAFSSGTSTSGGTAKDVVEIDMVGSFIHDTARFAFTCKNLTGNSVHKIGLAFVQDIGVQAGTLDLDGPLRLFGQPYLHNESLLTGGQIPASWQTFVPISPATLTKPATYHSIQAIVLPPNSAATEPTPPTRFVYGRTTLVEGSDYSTGTKKRNYDWLWNFQNFMDPTVVLDKNIGIYSTDGSVGLIWDQQLVPSGGSINVVSYLGSATSTTDYTGPMTLSVSAPPALGFVTNRTNPNAPFAQAAPSPFTISAYVQNLTDLNAQGNQFTINTVNFTIDLPPGLILAPGETNVKSLNTLGPGSEGTVAWNVEPDPNNPQSGTLLYTVTATPDISSGKAVQRTIQIPAPTTITLDPDVMHPGFFKMRSFPLQFGNTTPSQALNLPQGNNITPQIDTRSWDPLTVHYVENPNWNPGFGYWVRYNPISPSITTPQTFVINAALFPPLDAQVQPTASSFKVTYPKGWNQIGDPYVYDYIFSEMQVFNPTSLSVADIVTATDNVHQWVLPAVYHYNTDDPSASNWHYELEDNLGFTMKAGEAYWIFVLQDNLQFIYNGVDTPGGSVTKAAKSLGVGAGLGKSTTNNWRLNLVATSTHGTDQLAYIGVAPNASDSKDIYKWPKPPVFNPSTSLDIVHSDWGTANGRYAQDLRSPSLANKTWNIQISAPAQDKSVTVTWPSIAALVPRAYDVFIVDPSSHQPRSMRDSSSFTVAVTPGATTNLQVIATPRNGRAATAITNFQITQPTSRAIGGPQPAVTISYTLTTAADTQINIRDSRGKVIRTINGTTRVATDGSANSNIGQVVWDVKDQHGVNLTSGTYNVEIIAVNGSGQRSRQIKPYTLTR